MRKHFDAIALAITALTVVVAIAFVNGEALGLRTMVDADAEAHSDDSYFTSNDLNGGWDASDATTITLEGDSASVVGNGAYAWDGSVTIGASGTYVVSGTLDDGSIVVDANDNSKVWILLDGVTIYNDDDACIIVDQADKVFLTLADGSTNTLTCGDTMGESAMEDNTDGAIFAHDDLTINGAGSLDIKAGYKHGVSANDDLVITGGKVSVDAAKDGLHANDSLRICNAAIDVVAGDDGFAVDNEGGYLYVESGDVNIECADEGMAAVGDVDVAGGSIAIATGAEQGHHGIKSDGTCTISGGTVLVSACYEGVSAPYIDVTGGDLTVYPADDGLNASTGDSAQGMGGGPGGGMGGGPGGMGGWPGVMGGAGGQGGAQGAQGNQSEVQEGEQASTSEGEASQNGGPAGMGGGPDGQMPEGGPDGQMPQAGPGGERPEGGPDGQIPQGDQSSQDAVTDDESAEQGTGANQPPSSSSASSSSEQPVESGSGDDAKGFSSTDAETPWIHLSGGSITIVNDSGRDADGLDSNGDIIVTGGTIRVSLLGSGSNSAIDYGSESGGVCKITGGNVVACGASSMAEGFDSSSTQCSLLYGYSAGAEAGTTVALIDASGNTLISYEVPCSFTSVNLSCPQMELGQTYTVVIGDSAEEVTLSEVALLSGDVQSGGLGGGFAQGGGMRQHAGVQADGTYGQTEGTEGQAKGADGQTGNAQPPSDGMQQGGQKPNGQRNQEAEGDTPESEDDASSSDTSASTNERYTTETLVFCGISVGVLIVGLAIVVLFRRN